jgi:hypothetical protein
MPLAGLAKVEAHRFNPQPMLSSHTRPAVPARRTKNRPRCENSGLVIYGIIVALFVLAQHKVERRQIAATAAA